MSIVCVSVIGKQNEPLYLKTFGIDDPEQNLRYHYHVLTLAPRTESRLFVLASSDISR